MISILFQCKHLKEGISEMKTEKVEFHKVSHDLLKNAENNETKSNS